MLNGMEGEAISRLSSDVSVQVEVENPTALYAQAYCLFCRTGQERGVAAELSRWEQTRALFPQRTKMERRGGHWVHTNRPLLPGYVFLYAPAQVEMEKVRKLSNVLRVLRYADGEGALKGADRVFADWMWRQSGIIGLSKAVKIGERVQIVEGPLKDLGGTVIKLDSHKQVAKVQLNIVGSTQWLWLSFDYLK